MQYLIELVKSKVFPPTMRQRSTANSVELSTLSLNERILKECHALYADSEKGLVKIASGLGLSLLPPRKKIFILLIGNHSAGKSTFINWYVEEHIQKTGVAIETQGFTFVTSGKRRETLTGIATLKVYPHFKPLLKIPGVVDYLTTEISTSKQKKFSLVTFIDTPGLVDGDMQYQFDVNKTILWLGSMADLIFVFFDPIGQALCKRTLNIVEELNHHYGDRIKFYLSKADEAGHESDRQKVMMQIVQELCKRPGLNKCGFDMPTIFIPTLNKPTRCVNQIEQVCQDIERTINQTVQNTLNSLEKDCERIVRLIDGKIDEDTMVKSSNLRASCRGILLGILGVFLPVILFINFLSSSAASGLLYFLFGESAVELISYYLYPVQKFWKILPDEYHIYALGVMLLGSVVFVLLAKWCAKLRPTLSRSEKRALVQTRKYLLEDLKQKKHQMYNEYLEQCVGDQDL